MHSSTIGGPTAGAAACGFADTDAWPLVGADPRRPRRIRALYQQAGIEASVLARSRDGGRTWQRSTVTAATACAGGPSERAASVNPLFSVGPGGVPYYGQSWIGRREGNHAFGVDVHRLRGARDSGPPEPSFYGQNAAVAADPGRRGHLAMLWTEFDEIPNPFTYTTVLGSRTWFARSIDGGRSWDRSSVVSEPPPDTANVNARLVRTSDGALVGIFDRLEYRDAPGFAALGKDLPFTLYAVRSEDEGATWSPPVEIGSPVLKRVVDPDHQAPGEHATPAGSAKPDLAAGPGGSVVAVWHRGDRTLGGAIGRPSADGFTWTPLPAEMTARADYIQPAVAFNRRGDLGLFFYDFADDEPGDGSWSITPRFAVLRSGGRSWRTTALSEPFDLHRTNECDSATGLADPVSSGCDLRVDFMALGVYQDVEGLGRAFGVGYTVGPPVAADGYTDARYAKVAPAPPRGRSAAQRARRAG